MAAGDLINGPWQVELRALLTGEGTPYQIEPAGIGGLGNPAAKTHDVPFGHAAGSYLGRDYTGVRIITVPYTIAAETADLAGVLFVALSAAWAASPTDVPLHLRVPGFGHISLLGRPRGLVDDLSLLRSGSVRALATFVCGDPAITVVGP